MKLFTNKLNSLKNNQSSPISFSLIIPKNP
nr:MAG TPA: hypothetical protein [Caudoviricetes sp.]